MMSSKNIKLGIALILAMLLAACGGSTSPRESPAAASANRRPSASAAADPSQTMSVDGGNVTVSVTPRVLKRGLPLEFEIGMNTHSVDLSADMSKAVVLRTARESSSNPRAGMALARAVITARESWCLLH